MFEESNVILRESTKKPTDYYKTIQVRNAEGHLVNHQLLDYWKIWEDPAPVFVVMTERGAKGKSTQAKWLMKEIWDNFDYRSMWLMNTQRLIDKEKKSHLTKPKQYLDNFSGEETIKGDVVLSDPKDTESWYTKFAALSTAENEKGSRDNYGLLIYDEINVGTSMIKNSQTDMISSLIGTLSDPVNVYDDVFNKFIMHANYKSLSNPLLIDMGLTSINWEVTDVIDAETGELNMRVLCPILSEEDRNAVAEANKGNWKFRFQKQIGKEGHVYYNENLFDEINNVNSWMLTLPYSEKYYLHINNRYYECRFVESEDLGTVAYFMPFLGDLNEIKEESYIFALQPKDIKEGVEEHKRLKKSFRRYLGEDKVYFSMNHIRDDIISVLRK